MWEGRHETAGTLFGRGLHEAARQEWRVAYAEARRAGAAEGAVRSLGGLCAASLAVGDRFAGYQHALLAEHLAEGLPRGHELRLNAAINLQMSLSLLGVFSEARRHGYQWQSEFEESADPTRQGEFIHLLAGISLEEGDAAQAARLAARAGELATGDPYNRVVIGQTLAMAEMARGDTQQGALRLRECYGSFQEVGDTPDLLLCATELARAEIAHGSGIEAASWLDLAVSHLLESPASLDGMELGRLLLIGSQLARSGGQSETGEKLAAHGVDVLFANGRIEEGQIGAAAARAPIAVVEALSKTPPRAIDVLDRLVDLGVARKALFCLASLSEVAGYAHAIGGRLHPNANIALVEQAAAFGALDQRARVLLRLAEETPSAATAEARVYRVLREYAAGVAQQPYSDVLQQMERQAGSLLDPMVVDRLRTLHAA
ncbi:MAG: hypothetical protein M0Z66_12235 [Thermaerobacter sp.]|nr:hypothetical protein [Thermaerobacter sp.]